MTHLCDTETSPCRRPAELRADPARSWRGAGRLPDADGCCLPVPLRVPDERPHREADVFASALAGRTAGGPGPVGGLPAGRTGDSDRCLLRSHRPHVLWDRPNHSSDDRTWTIAETSRVAEPVIWEGAVRPTLVRQGRIHDQRGNWFRQFQGRIAREPSRRESGIRARDL
jgi:hypothetical protein